MDKRLPIQHEQRNIYKKRRYNNVRQRSIIKLQTNRSTIDS